MSRVRVRGHSLGGALWRSASRVPLIGARLRWALIWPVHRFWMTYWIDGERI